MSTNLKGRLEIRLSPEDRDAVLKAAKSEGVNKSEWCRRVFASVLGTPQVETGPSEAKGAVATEQSDPAAPVPSGNLEEQGNAPEGVRPAVQSQAPRESTLPASLKGEPACAPGGRYGSDAEAKPERITRPRRADVGPKPEAARKPRPKTGKGKKA